MKERMIKPEQLSADCFTMIGKQWMLITAEKEGRVNTMTASWGGMGILWNRKVVFFFIRPQRYTKEFVDASGRASLSFFGEEFRKSLTYLGRVSGRDENKIERAGLTVARKNGVPYFAEAKTVMLVKTLYAQEMDPKCFLDEALIKSHYPDQDYHTMYVAEIEEVLEKEEETYVITEIFEDDFGCEGRPEGQEAMVTVRLKEKEGQELTLRTLDRWLSDEELNEGDRVVLADGRLKRASEV